MLDLAAATGLRLRRLRAGPSRVDPLDGGRFVLRDDLQGEGFGGSKVRKLEWLLGQAEAGGGDVLTLGPAGGHHLLATAVYAKKAGLRTHAVAWAQPRSPYAELHLRALHAHAEHVWTASSKEAAVAVLARAWATVRMQAGYPPQVWGPGGSEPVGLLGWVQAGLELGAAVASGAMPAPPRIWLPLGTGGATAGLWVGLALAGLAPELVAVSVTGLGRAGVQVHAWRLRRVLAAAGVRVGPLGPLRVVQAAGAYAVPTPESEAAAEAAAAFGLALDPTYAAKAYAQALKEGPGLFVATHNGHALAPLLAGSLSELPPRLATLLTAAP